MEKKKTEQNFLAKTIFLKHDYLLVIFILSFPLFQTVIFLNIKVPLLMIEKKEDLDISIINSYFYFVIF